jgi:hypothetical protein
MFHWLEEEEVKKDDDTQKEDTCSNVSLVGRRRGQKR